MNDGLDAGALHLDHHAGAVNQLRRMDLADRRGSQGRLIETGEQRVNGFAQFTLDNLTRLLARENSDIILEPLQLLDIDLRQHIAPQAQKLAKLDERGPQPFERSSQPLCILIGRLHRLN
ncbi:hypothetical protein FZN37_004340 [Enterobacter hormaechei]|nr:hypothetical protein FZN37_004340 [Enterobacter hormaechei]